MSIIKALADDIAQFEMWSPAWWRRLGAVGVIGALLGLVVTGIYGAHRISTRGEPQRTSSVSIFTRYDQYGIRVYQVDDGERQYLVFGTYQWGVLLNSNEKEAKP